MRNFNDTFNQYLKSVKNEIEGMFNDDKSYKIIAEVEVILYLFEMLGLERKDIKRAYMILSGYYNNQSLQMIDLTTDQFECIYKVRGLVPKMQGGNYYKYVLEQYENINHKNYLMYQIWTTDNGIYFDINNGMELKRREILKDIFRSKILFKQNASKVYSAPIGCFKNKEGNYEKINFAKRMPNIVLDESLVEEINVDGKSEGINYSKNELIEYAKQMDAKVPESNYVTRLNKIHFEVRQGNDYKETDNITIDGLFNMVGRVGAGKSTLMDVLAYAMASQHKKVGIVVDSIASVYEKVSLFNKLGIKAAPIASYANREEQYNKAYSLVREYDFDDIEKCSFNNCFSTICILDGLRDWSDATEALTLGQEPCYRIIDKKKPNQNFICPYIAECPSHNQERMLKEADVYITTSGAFLNTRIAPAYCKDDIRVAEYLYYKANLVIFDEADRIQNSFEKNFTTDLILIDETNTNYLNRAVAQVTTLYTDSRLNGEKDLKEWFKEFFAVQLLFDEIVRFINANPSLTGKLTNQFLTAGSLLGRFKENKNYKNISSQKLFEKYISSSSIKGDIVDARLLSFIQEILVSEHEREIAKILRKFSNWYFQGIKCEEADKNMMSFIFLLSMFEKKFRHMVYGVERIDKLKELDIDLANSMYRGIRDLIAFIPIAAAGNQFGIRITTNDMGKVKTAILFKNKGCGRWLLTNYHQLYSKIDGHNGCNVLLMSGTSWAPGAYSYHINATVDGILSGDDSELRAIEQSRFVFEHFVDKAEPISVSGSYGSARYNNIRRIALQLIKENPVKKKSKLEIQLEQLEPNRKKILLLVGSYDESKALKEILDNEMPKAGDLTRADVDALVRDNDDLKDIYDSDNFIRRGQVSEFGKNDKKILIAPLMAIERGYNILNNDNVAAIGAVYFFIRPMPIPNDIGIVINKINYAQMQAISMLNNLMPVEYIEQIFKCRTDRIREMQKLMIEAERLGYAQLTDEQRKQLCMNTFVTMCQVIGRLIRGGARAEVHFCDAKFATGTVSDKIDTAKSSLLVGIIRTLEELIYSEDVQVRTIAHKLYYPFYKGLKECEGLHYEKRKE